MKEFESIQPRIIENLLCFHCDVRNGYGPTFSRADLVKIGDELNRENIDDIHVIDYVITTIMGYATDGPKHIPYIQHLKELIFYHMHRVP